MIASKILGYYWIDGKANPVDIVSKHWDNKQVWHPFQRYYSILVTLMTTAYLACALCKNFGCYRSKLMQKTETGICE
jgi:hypothetical protein